jgi:hypothetical protein
MLEKTRKGGRLMEMISPTMAAFEITAVFAALGLGASLTAVTAAYTNLQRIKKLEEVDAS